MHLESFAGKGNTKLMPSAEPTTVADKIEEIGFGWYQIQVFILSAGFVVAEGSELMMAAGLTNAVSLEFGIEAHFGRSMLMTCTFTGFALGTILSGPLGDTWGRRIPMLIGYLGVVVTALCTFFVYNKMLLYLMRIILGVFGGIGIPTALITISEVSPKAFRGVSTAMFGAAYCLGDIWAATGLRLVMPDLVNGHWRMLLFWAMIPSITLLLFGSVSPVTRYDTPYFLAASGRKADAVASLNVIAEVNRKPHLKIPTVDLLKHVSQAKGYVPFSAALRVMSHWPMFMYTCVLCLLFFGKDFGYYGMNVFWPLAWAQIAEEGTVRMYAATELLYTAALGIPGVLLAIALTWGMPRRHALALGGFMCAVATHFVALLDMGHRRGLIGVLIFKLFFPSWQMVTMLLPSEIFPTEIRAWGYASVALAGRLATIISPFAVEYSHQGFLSAVLVLGAASGALTYACLPETRDSELKSLDEAESTGTGLSNGGGPAYGSLAEVSQKA